MTRVSVITPTWQRHRMLLDRCVPSVAAQDYPDAEHVVVSDGPDPVLAGILAERFPSVRYAELPAHGGHWGHEARLLALGVCTGQYITYLDDDDAYRPQHCRVLAGALNANPGAGFAYSLMRWSNGTCIGADPPVYGQIGTPAIMHRRSVLAAATWERSEPSVDWDLVSRWLAAGIGYVHVPDVTVDVWPSAFRLQDVPE